MSEAEYADMKTGADINVSSEKFIFPTTGTVLVLKKRPPIAKEVETN